MSKHPVGFPQRLKPQVVSAFCWLFQRFTKPIYQFITLVSLEDAESTMRMKVHCVGLAISMPVHFVGFPHLANLFNGKSDSVNHVGFPLFGFSIQAH